MKRGFLVALVALVSFSSGLPMAPMAGAIEPEVTFVGQGYGHGRGMGQWGALGYAVDRGANYQQILDHFYGGTYLASDAGNLPITVRLDELTGQELRVGGLNMTITAGGSTQFAGNGVVRIVRSGLNTFWVYGGSSCSSTPNLLWGPISATQVAVSTSQVPNTLGDLLATCLTDTSWRGYRGEVLAAETGSGQAAVNRLPIDSYLLGVVPREMPASWAEAGAGRGMQATKAQAVAARSYALVSQTASYAKTCSTIACQVYGGAYLSTGGTVQALEDPRTNAAVLGTSGQVRRFSDGRVARTEFSASTGGWTAGGVFPSVQDLGDAISSNPNKSWTKSLTYSQIGSALGLSGVTSVTVTQRNGLGAMGGRVTQVRVGTASGAVTLSGEQVRSKLGLKSDWFATTTMPLSSARSFATALYHDFLGRSPDTAGLESWSGALVAGVVTQASVASSFALSPEYIGSRVGVAYQVALKRPADTPGLQYYTQQIQVGLTYPQAVAQIFGSAEALAAAGGSTQAWVASLYPGLLGRDPDQGGVAYWTSMAGTIGRDQVAYLLATSEEARRLRTAWYYRTFLGRDPDAGGLAFWSQFLMGQGDLTVPSTLAASAEYFAVAQLRFPSS